MSAPRASETPSNSPANLFLRDQIASLRTVQVPGTPVTYANRAYLRDLGLRWDPEHHRWHGTTTADRVNVLRERFHLEVRVFGTLGAEAQTEPMAPKPVLPRPAPSPAPMAVSARDPARGPPRDSSRTRLEARLAFPGTDEGEGAEEIAAPTRAFSLREIKAGLPDDSREEDERQEERLLRDLRGRVKRARAVVASTPGLAEVLSGDWRKAAMFYSRFGISETLFRHEAPAPVGLEQIQENPRTDSQAASSNPVLPFLGRLGRCRATRFSTHSQPSANSGRGLGPFRSGIRSSSGAEIISDHGPNFDKSRLPTTMRTG